ncbi:MAG: CoA-binding protein [Candidatus Micrarchaeota archaeon]|nr:CoA-binding protein [Candidatus Micrarchaeota archaeon]
MFKPIDYKNKIIAVVGVSSDPTKYGYKIFRDLVANKYRVYGINPKDGVLFENKIYRNLQELIKSEIKPDLVMLVVKPEVSEQIVEECKELGVKEIWFQPGSESEDAMRKAEAYGIRYTANACFMARSGIW